MIGHGSFDMWVDNQVLLARIIKNETTHSGRD